MSASSLMQELVTTTIPSRTDGSSFRTWPRAPFCFREPPVFRFIHAAERGGGRRFARLCCAGRGQGDARDVSDRAVGGGKGVDHSNNSWTSTWAWPTTGGQHLCALEGHGSWTGRKLVRGTRRRRGRKRTCTITLAEVLSTRFTIQGLLERDHTARQLHTPTAGIFKRPSSLSQRSVSSRKTPFPLHAGRCSKTPAPALFNHGAAAVGSSASVVAAIKVKREEEKEANRIQHDGLSGIANVDKSAINAKKLARVFRRLQRSGGLSRASVSLIDLRCLLMCCCRRKLVDDADAVLKGIEELFPDSVPVGCYKAVIEGYGMIGRLSDMERVFERARGPSWVRGRGLYESLIVGYCAAGRVEQAFSVFRESKEILGSVNLRAYGLLIKACGKHGRYETEAEKLFWEMRSIMLNRNRNRAREVDRKEEGRERGGSAAAESQATVAATAYGNGLRALTKSGNARKAWKVFDRDTHGKGGRPLGPTVYEASARACAAMGWTQTGVDMLKEMKWVEGQMNGGGGGGGGGGEGVKFTPFYAALIELYIGGRRYADIVRAVLDMEEKEVPASFALRNMLIRACADARGRWARKLVQVLRKGSWEECRVACMLLFPPRQTHRRFAGHQKADVQERKGKDDDARENLHLVSHRRPLPAKPAMAEEYCLQQHDEPRGNAQEGEDLRFEGASGAVLASLTSEATSSIVVAGDAGRESGSGNGARGLGERAADVVGCLPSGLGNGGPELEENLSAISARGAESGSVSGKGWVERGEGEVVAPLSNTNKGRDDDGKDAAESVGSQDRKNGYGGEGRAGAEDRERDGNENDDEVEGKYGGDDVWSQLEELFAKRAREELYLQSNAASFCNALVDALVRRGMEGRARGVIRLARKTWPYAKVTCGTSASNWSLDCRGLSAEAAQVALLDWLDELATLMAETAAQSEGEEEGDHPGSALPLPLDVQVIVGKGVEQERTDNHDDDGGAMEGGSAGACVEGDSGSRLSSSRVKKKLDLTLGGGGLSLLGRVEAARLRGSLPGQRHVAPSQHQQQLSISLPSTDGSLVRRGLGKGVVRNVVLKVLRTMNSPFTQSREDDSLLVAGAHSVKDWLSTMNMPILERLPRRWSAFQQHELSNDKRTGVGLNGVEGFMKKKVAVLRAEGKARRMVSSEEVVQKAVTPRVWRIRQK